MVRRCAQTAASRRVAATRTMALFVSRQLKLMDWVSRHEFYITVTSATRGIRSIGFADELDRLLSPDELMNGKLTGTAARAVIISKNKAGSRQLTLVQVGFRRR
jgi:hypothetical protein